MNASDILNKIAEDDSVSMSVPMTLELTAKLIERENSVEVWVYSDNPNEPTCKFEVEAGGESEPQNPYDIEQLVDEIILGTIGQDGEGPRIIVDRQALGNCLAQLEEKAKALLAAK